MGEDFLCFYKRNKTFYRFMFLINYYSLLVIWFFAALLALLVFLLSFVIYFQSVNDEKNSIYECGFVPFGDARNKFEVKFYLVSILFIVFDLEIAFLLPAVMAVSKLGIFHILMLTLFLVFLALGFIYE